MLVESMSLESRPMSGDEGSDGQDAARLAMTSLSGDSALAGAICLALAPLAVPSGGESAVPSWPGGLGGVRRKGLGNELREEPVVQGLGFSEWGLELRVWGPVCGL